jgi:hypothetical protein
VVADEVGADGAGVGDVGEDVAHGLDPGWEVKGQDVLVSHGDYKV